ncbi:MAG: peptidoglycan DD-metalloendopeptidase family protein [Bacteroidales bacterium]|nr:peptidoglycan DD-metalloendopeptidase family protein [Bacteroidales bacterium]
MNRLIFSLFSIFLMINPLYAEVNSLQQPEELPVYVVQEGDTLSIIATRFGISVNDLISTNNIDNPNAISIGMELAIPGLEGIRGKLFLEEVPLGETIYSFSHTREMDIEIVSRINKIVSPVEFYAGSEIVVPESNIEQSKTLFDDLSTQETVFDIAILHGENPWALLYENNHTNSWEVLPGNKLYAQLGESVIEVNSISSHIKSFEVSPLPIQQGKTIQIQIQTDIPFEINGKLGDYHLSFFKLDENYFSALQGINGRESLGLMSFQIEGLSKEETEEKEATFAFEQMALLYSGYFGEDPPIYVDPQTISPEVVEPEEEFVRSLTKPITSEKYWTGKFEYPIDMPWITSPFGGDRIYNDSYRNFHTGLDFGVQANNLNIYACAPGIVVYTGPLSVRGNATIIDHGRGVYSGYWHQSNILVEMDDWVETGQIIGLIGTTGRSTGPHLHWEIWVNGVQVNPLFWIENEIQ